MQDFAEVIRKEIRKLQKSGTSLYRIAADTGMSYSGFHNFANGKKTISLETASRLCDYLGLELRGK